MGNRSSTLSLPWGGEGIAAKTNKRKREDSIDPAELRLPRPKQSPVSSMQKQQPGIVVRDTNESPSFSTIPESILLHIFSFILKPQKGMIRDNILAAQLALENTCHRFSTLLRKDSTIKLLYGGLLSDVQFNYQVDSEREKLFLKWRIATIRHFQSKTDKIICHHMGGADGVRTIVDKMLVKMEVPRDDDSITYIRAPPYLDNGFKLFLRGDSIAYLTQVVEQNMLNRLNSVMKAAIYRCHPPSSNSHPTVCLEDLLFVDLIRESDLQLYTVRGGRYEVNSSSRLSSADNSDNMWKWQHEECTAEDVIGAEQKQHMVRAIASRAGIVKLTGDAFDCIAAEILHSMAVIVIHAFEASKSLWCHDENIGSYWDDDYEGYFYADVDDDTIGEEDEDNSSLSSEQSKEVEVEVDYSNQPPPPRETVHEDEEGKQLCVIIPRQIKDAAVRIGMKPLLDDQGWEAGEDRTKHEEVEEAILMYKSSSEDEESLDESSSEDEESSDEESGDVAEDYGQECYCDDCLEGCLDEDANSAGELGDHASEAEEDDASFNVREVVEVVGI